MFSIIIVIIIIIIIIMIKYGLIMIYNYVIEVYVRSIRRGGRVSSLEMPRTRQGVAHNLRLL